ncbi:hypothetical protein GCM10009802_52740 [Streptomyces synnematoformans]|uniref:Uncharacterized protein n=1 Tax=Streptomyces synnematoformans TaxID=415721 RepID=A0ABP5L8W6_9ACTN
MPGAAPAAAAPSGPDGAPAEAPGAAVVAVANGAGCDTGDCGSAVAREGTVASNEARQPSTARRTGR